MVMLYSQGVVAITKEYIKFPKQSVNSVPVHIQPPSQAFLGDEGGNTNTQTVRGRLGYIYTHGLTPQ